MYVLYHDKDENKIQIKKGGVSFKDLPYNDEVQRHNVNYYYSANRKALVEKGRELKELWLSELHRKIEAIEMIKI